MMNAKKLIVVGLMGAVLTISACSTERLIDNTVDTTGFVAKAAVKGTVGAGRLAVSGVKKIAGAE